MAELAEPEGFRVALLCLGYRGDVQPLVLLGRRLQIMGHTVRAFVPYNLVGLCSRWGVEARAVYGDLEEVLPKATSVETLQVEMTRWKYMHSDLLSGDPLDGLLEFKPEVVVWNAVTFKRDPGLAAYERLYPVPTVFVHTSCYEPGSTIDWEFDVLPCRPTFLATSPLLRGVRAVEIQEAGVAELNGVYTLTVPGLWQKADGSGPQCWQVREREIWYLGDPNQNAGKPAYTAKGSAALAAMPPESGWKAEHGDAVGKSMPVAKSAAPQVRDPVTLPPHVHWTGAWLPSDDCRLLELVEAELPPEVAEELLAFIGAGPAPIAIGFGSVIGLTWKGEPSPRELLLLVLRALRLCDRRAVVLGGWARLQDVVIADPAGGADQAGGSGAEDLAELADFARASCFFTAAVPHQWLLPHCSCHVHHGGAGTLQASLHAGKPCVIFPFQHDQHHWADAVRRLEVGVCFKEQVSNVAPKELAKAIALAEEMAPAAKELGERLRAEGGNATAKAAEVLHGFMQREARSWASGPPATPVGRESSTCKWDCLIL